MTTRLSLRSPSRTRSVAGRVQMFLGGHRDPLEVLGIQALEERDAPQEQHRLEITQRPARSWHLGPRAQGLAGEARDPGIPIIGQTTQDGIGVLRIGPIILEQPDEGAGQPAIADRVECLDRLGPDLGVVGPERPADDAAGFGRTEDDERTERQVHDGRPHDGQRVDEEAAGRARLACRRSAACAARVGSGPSQVRGALEARLRPGDERRRGHRGRARAARPVSACCARREPVAEDVEQAGRDRRERREGIGRRPTDLARLVVQGGDQVRGAVAAGRVEAASASTAARRTTGDGSSRQARTASSGTGSPSCRTASSPAARSAASGPSSRA